MSMNLSKRAEFVAALIDDKVWSREQIIAQALEQAQAEVWAEALEAVSKQHKPTIDFKKNPLFQNDEQRIGWNLAHKALLDAKDKSDDLDDWEEREAIRKVEDVAARQALIAKRDKQI